MDTDKKYFSDTNGQLLCNDHAGGYLRFELDQRPKAKRIKTPITTWTRMDSLEVAFFFAEFGYCCETCHSDSKKTAHATIICSIHMDESVMNKDDVCEECLDDAHEAEILAR